MNSTSDDLVAGQSNDDDVWLIIDDREWFMRGTIFMTNILFN